MAPPPASPWSNPFAGTGLEPVLERFAVDFDPVDRQPSWARWAVATVVAVGGSLLANALLVAAGKALFPSTEHFVHFLFTDYVKLTVPGVLVACAGWPVVTRASSRPRWLFFRLAVVTTLVLFVPDAWIWLRGESHAGILVLMVMHVVIALVTYNALVRIAPAGDDRRRHG